MIFLLKDGFFHMQIETLLIQALHLFLSTVRKFLTTTNYQCLFYVDQYSAVCVQQPRLISNLQDLPSSFYFSKHFQIGITHSHHFLVSLQRGNSFCLTCLLCLTSISLKAPIILLISLTLHK